MKSRKFFNTLGLAALGFAVVAKRNIEALSAELVKEGQMNQKEAKVWVSKMSKTVNAQSKQMADRISKAAHATMQKSGLATKSDIAELKKRLDTLENGK